MSNFVPVYVYDLIDLLKQTNFNKNNDKEAIIVWFKKFIYEYDFEQENDEFYKEIAQWVNRCYNCQIKKPKDKDSAYCKSCHESIWGVD